MCQPNCNGNCKNWDTPKIVITAQRLVVPTYISALTTDEGVIGNLKAVGRHFTVVNTRSDILVEPPWPYYRSTDPGEVMEYYARYAQQRLKARGYDLQVMVEVVVEDFRPIAPPVPQLMFDGINLRSHMPVKGCDIWGCVTTGGGYHYATTSEYFDKLVAKFIALLKGALMVDEVEVQRKIRELKRFTVTADASRELTFPTEEMAKEWLAWFVCEGLKAMGGEVELGRENEI